MSKMEPLCYMKSNSSFPYNWQAITHAGSSFPYNWQAITHAGHGNYICRRMTGTILKGFKMVLFINMVSRSMNKQNTFSHETSEWKCTLVNLNKIHREIAAFSLAEVINPKGQCHPSRRR